MTPAEELFAAAEKLRNPLRRFTACQCADHSDTWFDRSICPEPCGMMHTICCECGLPLGGCVIAATAQEPTELDLALADTLEMMGATFADFGGPAPEHQEAFPIFRVARLINGE